ncbi:MAG: GlcNAc-PI de-N-acetylase [Cytophagaceae bacterium SCN 52-12]|nr:MAG: GlcNAc-PI de-N-acetylase [Cytophagaceae bacterium SCN 52-12]
MSGSYTALDEPVSENQPIRVIVFGAHPDDCELGAGGLAALYVSQGHQVKFVSLTNGDKGHQDLGGGPLARRRYAESMESGKRLGVAYEILDNHDGELLPTLENRLEVIRMIREWKADIVISHRPNDYHPDHRNAALLVQDAAYLVIVPNVLPGVRPLKKNPVFLYTRDRFQRPNPHRPDIAVDITTVYDKKIDAADAHVSQFYEWLPWTNNTVAQVPKEPAARKQWLSDGLKSRSAATPEIRKSLEKWYGPGKTGNNPLAETFEICEYGSQPSEADIRKLFPMFSGK